MFIVDPKVPNISENVNWLAKVVWPALATLVPAAVTAIFKWAQDHTSKQRTAELIERITSLSSQIAALPEIPLSNSTPNITPRSALTAELESALHELTVIRNHANLRRFRGLTTTTARIRAALLLYRPKGFIAWLLHLAFYVYSIALIWALLEITTDQSATPLIGSVSDAFAFIVLFGIFGIPPLILRYFASRIHARQCTGAQPASEPSLHLEATPSGPAV